MKQRIVEVQGTFDGLYEWGKGWDFETASSWRKFWDTYNGCYWSFFKEEHSYGDSHYLVSTHGSIFLHPMDFHAVLSGPNAGVMSELKEACERCAEACGGTFGFSYRVAEVEFPSASKQWDGKW